MQHHHVSVIAVVLLRVRSMPSQPFWQAVAKKSDIERRKMNLISRYIIRQMAVMAVYALLPSRFVQLFEIINEVGDLGKAAITVQNWAVCFNADACARI